MPEGYKIGEGYPAPTLQELKEFTCWLIESTKGRLADDGRPTKNLIKVWTQEFVPGFFLETGNEISSQDATELYHVLECPPSRLYQLIKLDEGSVISVLDTDIETIRFGTAIWDCDEPIYSGGLFLLALALADNALYGYSSLEEVFEQRIPEGQDELVLRWNEDAKNRCIVRKVTATGVSEDPLIKEMYAADFRKILANACYFKSKNVYRNDYLANCSGVDVFNALMGKPADNTHIDYFQGYSQFHEHGLPRRLPIEEAQKIDADPQLVTKATEIRNAESDDDIKRLKRDYNILKRKIYTSMYQQFQSE
ncbi:unnamed protein product [Aspergillus oryzae]|uniref:Unnamed protein product n=1 Tax=Aspergillus oryzae TaxID=5062 RepID=A0AAN5C210_ASPOZ|nr:unnamed protein product [Aspergillus oryzae]